MKISNFSVLVRNIRKNFWLLFSAMAALCLFFAPSLPSLTITVGIFATVMIAAAFDMVKPSAMPEGKVKIVSMLLTALLVYTRFDTFTAIWSPFRRVGVLADMLGLTTPTLLFCVGMVGSIVGFYSIYILICRLTDTYIVHVFLNWVAQWILNPLKKILPVQEKAEAIVNLKKNWLLPISSMFFFILTLHKPLGYCVELWIALIIMVIIASRISSVWDTIRQETPVSKILCICSAVGICLENRGYFYSMKLRSLHNMGFQQLLDEQYLWFSYISAFCGLFFVFFCLVTFWKKMRQIFSEVGFTDHIGRKEWSVYILILILSLGFMVFAFTQSEAFYETDYDYDVIYTSDSSALIRDNVYLVVKHPENDLRQPLFAVFAAPFIGLAYFISGLLSANDAVRVILVNGAQIIMLFAANLMLAKMMKLNSMKRICFMLLTSCTYTQLLFMLMMEQYIVAYFWLIVCIYLIVEKQQPNRIALWGAGGTLLTSMILLPFLSRKSPLKNFRGWFMDMVKYGLEFVMLLLVFCRFDVIFNLIPRITFLSRFTGKTVTFSNKIYQYTAFISNCFIAPDAGVDTTTFEYISWQQNPATSISLAGIFILGLAVVSAVWNRNKNSSLLAGGWVIFSGIMLIGLGWGTQENGLILYALYFGWAILVLLFQLAEKIENELKSQLLIPTLTGCTVMALLAINIPAIMEMLHFAIVHYPV